MSKGKQTKGTGAFSSVVEKTESAGAAVTGSVPQFEALKKLVADARADALADSKALARKVSELEKTVAVLDKGKQRSFPRGTGEYTVVEGDKLVMIAKNELGQSGRMTEIATMNYDRYPSLRTSNDVEAGWKLRMPPR